jgi:hypothetical protein
VHTHRYAFLTQLTHTALAGYFTFLVVYDLYHLIATTPTPPPSSSAKARKKKPEPTSSSTAKRLNALNDYLFVLLFVFTSLVGLMFWGLFFYDQELILPRSVQHYYPQDLNYFQHGAVMLLMWLEAVVCRRAHRNRSAAAELALVLAFGLLYLVWTFALVRLNGGQWPYAFQRDMDLRGHAAFNLVGAGVIVVAFALARGVRALLNPNPRATGAAPHAGKKRANPKKKQT